MSEYQIGALEKIANKTFELLGTFQKQIMDSLNNLKVLPELFKKVLESLNEGFSRQIEAMYESQIYLKLANLSSRKSQVDAENKAIAEFKTQLMNDLKEIEERYAKIKEDIIIQKDKSERNIDNHLFELNNLFPHTMYKADLDDLKPLIETIELEAKDSYVERVNNYSKINSNAQNTLDTFINRRNSFFNNLNTYTSLDKIEDETDYFLPITVAEVFNEESNDYELSIIPSIEIDFKANEKIENTNSKFIIDNDLYNFAEYLNNESVKSKILNELNWKEDSNMKNKLLKNLTTFFDKEYKENSLNGIKKTLLDVVNLSNIKFLAGSK